MQLVPDGKNIKCLNLAGPDRILLPPLHFLQCSFSALLSRKTFSTRNWKFCLISLLTQQYSDNFHVATYQPVVFSIFSVLKKQNHVFISLFQLHRMCDRH